MLKFILRRCLESLPLLLIIAVLTFLLLKTAGDPLQYLTEDPRVTEAERFRLRALMGLNEPLALQFLTWLIGDDWRMRDIDGDAEPDVYGEQRGVLRGDFGESIRLRIPATEAIAQKLPNTLLLGVVSYIVTIVISLLVGIYAALRRYTLTDNVLSIITFVLFSMPIYLVALISIYIFAVQFRLAGLPYLPVQGMYLTRGSTGSLAELAWHMILPVFCLSAVSIAGYSRFIRASMIEVLDSEYVRTAKSKGLLNKRIIYLHALKNASLPLVTLIGLNVPFVLGGAVVTEQIFSWDGMGLLFTRSLAALDYPVLILFVMMTAIAVVVCQLLTDITYA
ncbi:MAG: ABC transporter permease [Chloroflexi bacterium]|nr:ABC transporter permease [Chloroflexota bacterium]